MRLLLDNCVPVGLARHIKGHTVATAVDKGWAALNDGPLLDVMAGEFDVLLTVDRSIPFQHLVAGRPIAIVILRSKSNRVDHLARLVPQLIAVLRTVQPGQVREVS